MTWIDPCCSNREKGTAESPKACVAVARGRVPVHVGDVVSSIRSV